MKLSFTRIMRGRKREVGERKKIERRRRKNEAESFFPRLASKNW